MTWKTIKNTFGNKFSSSFQGFELTLIVAVYLTITLPMSHYCHTNLIASGVACEIYSHNTYYFIISKVFFGIWHIP